MKLKNIINELSSKTGINVKDKSIYSLSKFINDIDIVPTKAKNFESLSNEIDMSYFIKSFSQEQYFIRNIAHTYNKKTQEPLFDFNKFDLLKNYNRSFSKYFLSKLNSKVNEYNNTSNIKEKSLYEMDIFELSKNLYTYNHNGSTSFLDEFNAKYGFKKLAKVKYLDFKNQDKTSVMLTITLDRTYRKYIKSKDFEENMTLGEKTGLEEIDENANLEELIEKSYFRLNEVFQTFYNNFKQKNKRSGDKNKLDYILVFEPHKSLTLHLHLLFYCDDIQLANLKESWNVYLKGLTHSQKISQDFKVIDKEIATSATYLSKYLIKEYGDNKENNSFFTKFRSYFSKFNMFRTSNFYHTTQKKIDLMYQYLTKNYPDILDLIKSTTVPLYEVLEKFDIEGIFEFEKEKIKTINFDRKKIKEDYENLLDDSSDTITEIKGHLIDTIETYSNIAILSRIKSATFNYDHQKIEKILNSYNIDTSKLVEEKDVPPDKFYEVGIYEMFNYDLEDSIYLINSTN